MNVPDDVAREKSHPPSPRPKKNVKADSKVFSKCRLEISDYQESSISKH
jgi:hypothetical protein